MTLSVPQSSPSRKGGIRSATSESEYAILTDFAARLSSYVTERSSQSPLNCISLNDHNLISDNDSLEEDAELLMSLMSSAPAASSPKQADQADLTEISPSLSFETNYHSIEGPRNKRYQQEVQPVDENYCYRNQAEMNFHSRVENGNTVNVTYPCLSLMDVDERCSPVNLLSRPRHVNDKACDDVIKYVANQLALNAMCSFKVAVDWRVKVWISQLLKCMSTKSSKIDETTEGQSRESSSFTNIEHESSDKKLVRALLCTLSSVSVSDIRTTVQVLEQQAKSLKTSENRDLLERPNINGECNLTHAVNVEFNLTISNRFDDSVLNKMNVSLQSQGFIHGAFRRSADSDLALTDVELVLDTFILAHGIERQSRSIVRSFTEEYIVSCHPALYPYVSQAKTSDRNPKLIESSAPAVTIQPIANVDEKEDESSVKSSLNGQSDDSPIPTSFDAYAFPVVTPNQDTEQHEGTYFSLNVPSSLSVTSVLDPDSSKRRRLSSSKFIVHPRRVSPNFLKSDSSSESLKDKSINISSSLAPGFTDCHQYLNLPSIISPNPMHESSIITDSKSAAKHDSAPSLPMLAELVCGTTVRQITN